MKIRLAFLLILTGAVGWVLSVSGQVPKAGLETAPLPRMLLVQVPHQIVRVTPPDAKAPGETSVAINPAFPDHIVVSSFQSALLGKYHSNNFTYNSTDGGQTWSMLAAPNPDRRNQGDDVVTFGSDGTVYHCYLSASGYSPRDPRITKHSSGLFVRKSRDGIKWDAPVAIVDHFNTAEPMEDKPWIAVDGSPNSPHRGNLYCAWTRFDKYGSADPEHRSRIYFSRSKDGGQTFQPPVRLSDKSGGALDDKETLEGAVPCVGPKGEVYVAWAGAEAIWFDKSDDGGFSFGKDIKVAEQPGGWNFSSIGVPRHSALPITGCDTTRGKNGGSVYICWGDKRNGDADMFVAASRDGGKSWEAPVRVNTDTPKNGRDQLFPWMAIDPSDGSVNVAFYDRRDATGPTDGRLRLTLARSVDGGRTFTNFAIKQEPFQPANRLAGDYIGIAALGGRVVVAYPHILGKDQVVSVAMFRFTPNTTQARNE